MKTTAFEQELTENSCPSPLSLFPAAKSFMVMLFTLADTGERENLRLIIIPAQ
jgi:hypothetical protein